MEEMRDTSPQLTAEPAEQAVPTGALFLEQSILVELCTVKFCSICCP